MIEAIGAYTGAAAAYQSTSSYVRQNVGECSDPHVLANVATNGWWDVLTPLPEVWQATFRSLPKRGVVKVLMPVDKSGNRVQRMFGEIAPKYDRMNHLLSMNVDRYWRWRTVRIVRAKTDQPILDVCTGTGDLAFAFYRRTRGQVPIVAVDFCREMLDIGQRKQTKAGIDGDMSFVEADAQDLPFEDNRFQIVSVAFGLRNVSDTDKGLKEMVRVCAPDGQLAVLEFSMPRRQPFRAAYSWYFRRVLPKIGQWFTRNSENAYSYLPASVGEFASDEALAQRMQDAGLRKVKLHRLTFGIATLYVGVK